MLGTLDAKIYNLDAKECQVTPWYQLENVRYFYDFFKKHEKEFTQWALFFLSHIDKSYNVLYCISVLVTLIQLGGFYVYNRYSK